MFSNLFKIKSKSTPAVHHPDCKPESPDDVYMQLSLATHEHLKHGEYGLYRNDLYNMSEILRKEGKYKDQLKLLLIIYYVDLAGYSSLSWLDYGFDPIPPVIAPAVERNIRTASKQCGMSASDVIDFYRTVVHDRMLPAHLFTVNETARLLKATIDGKEGGNPLIPKRSKFKYKYV